MLSEKGATAPALLSLVHVIQSVNSSKKMKRKKLESGRGSPVPLAKKETSRRDEEGLEFFILVQIIQIVNLRSRQNLPAKYVQNVKV